MTTLGQLRDINQGVHFFRNPLDHEDFWNRYLIARRRVIEAFCESRGLSVQEASMRWIPNHAQLGEEAEKEFTSLKQFIIEDPLGPPISVFFMANTTPPAP